MLTPTSSLSLLLFTTTSSRPSAGSDLKFLDRLDVKVSQLKIPLLRDTVFVELSRGEYLVSIASYPPLSSEYQQYMQTSKDWISGWRGAWTNCEHKVPKICHKEWLPLPLSLCLACTGGGRTEICCFPNLKKIPIWTGENVWEWLVAKCNFSSTRQLQPYITDSGNKQYWELL